MTYTIAALKPLPLVHPARTGRWTFDPKYCSLLKYVKLTEGTMDDYRQLSCHHYRDTRVGPIAGIWTLRYQPLGRPVGPEVIGVIVYTYPAPNVAARTAALGTLCDAPTAAGRLRQLNQQVRCISRVIIEPRWRGVGLATWLVAMTMPRLNVPIIESMAAMGRFHPFLERAKMRRFDPPENPKIEAVRTTLTELGIGPALWHDPLTVHAKIEALPMAHQAWVDMAMRRMLGAFGCRRNMNEGFDRTAFVLNKLAMRWSYFVWRNKRVNSE